MSRQRPTALARTEPRRTHGGKRRWIAFAGALVASLAGLTALAGAASAHDAPPTGSASCESYGPAYTWQVADGTTIVENTGGAQWQLSFAASAGQLAASTATGTGDMANGPTFAVNGLADTVDTVTVTTTLIWGTPPSYTDGTTTLSTTISRPVGGCVQSLPVPGAPTVNPPTCTAVGSLNVPADTSSVVWTVLPTYHAGDTGSFVVTATAQNGSVFSDGNTTETYPVTVAPIVTGSSCITVIAPVAPSITASECTGPGTHSNATLVIPSTTGVIYKIDGVSVSGQTISETPGTTVTVVATPEIGYAFAAAQHVEYVETFGSAGHCLVRTAPVAPTSTDGACTTPGHHSDATLTIPTTSNVIYRVSGVGPDVSGQTLTETVGTTVSVVATPAAGYRFHGPQSVTESITFADTGECNVVATPVVPSISQSVCTGPGTNTIATLVIPTTLGVIYQIDGTDVSGTITELAGTTVTVTAVPANGYAFEQNATTSWTEQFSDAGDCLVGVLVAKPSFTASECTGGAIHNGSYTIPSTRNVSYRVNGSPVDAGTYPGNAGSTITVTASAGAGFSMGGTTSWTHTFATAVCKHSVHTPNAVHVVPVPPLGSTGVPVATMALAGSLLAVLGFTLCAAGSYRRRTG